jgi:methylase of polypeptide subunit release factors
LRHQIAGVDINPEAVKVAAFSLYLAMLHYQRPRDILQSEPLPSLTYDPKRKRFDPKRHYNTLLPANTFDLEDAVKDANVRNEFASSSFDVVIGNPPWGDPLRSKDPATIGKRKVMDWCESKGLSIGASTF